ncbi:MAG: hypothetical protein ACD_56C00106G0004 [uncultured bacterium]|nr:MAG: hypothetical protein ACD_56C00106G0004 [uncultured bacterium]
MSIGSLLYLHRGSLSSAEIKSDLDFLIKLLENEGRKKKRWEVYLNGNEESFEDGDVHSHSLLMEHLAYKESMIEGLDEEKAITLMWTARFHDLGELKDGDINFNLKTENDDAEEAIHIRKKIHSNLKSDYVKEMLEKALSISLDRRNLPNEEFDYVDFFQSLEGRGYMNTAIKMLEKKHISQWNMLMANVFFNQLIPMIEHGKKYRSVRIYLQKNAKMISRGIENHFTHEHVHKSFEKIYGQGLEEKKKSMDISTKKIDQIKKAWEEFIEKY